MFFVNTNKNHNNRSRRNNCKQKKKNINQIRIIKDQGRWKKKEGGDDVHLQPGFNFKYSDLQASIGLTQIRTLDLRKQKLIKIYDLYKKNLKDVKQIKFFEYQSGEIPLWVDIKTAKKDQLFNFLRDKNIFCRKYWQPLSYFKSFNFKSFTDLKNSYVIYNQSLWLPSGYHMNKKKIKYICDQIKKFFKV